MKNQKGMALVFVVIVVFSLSLLFPAILKKISVGSGLVSLEIEFHRIMLELRHNIDAGVKQLKNRKECFDEYVFDWVSSGGGVYRGNLVCRETDFQFEVVGIMQRTEIGQPRKVFENQVTVLKSD